MNRTEKLRKFLADYEDYIENVLKINQEKVREQLQHWRKPNYWVKYAEGSTGAIPSPIRAAFTRIKRPEKVVDKIIRRPKEFPQGLAPVSFKAMHDTIGVRVIVYFLSHLPLIDQDLRKSRMFEISKKYPPEAYLPRDLLQRLGLTHIYHKQKESGYVSVHYTVRYRSRSLPKEKCPWFELQIRTLAQELWSEMEHILAYKSEIRTDFSTKRRFQILSKEIGAIDEHFNLIYEELKQHQEHGQHADKDNLNVENLPAALSELGIRCAQQDIQPVLKLLASRSVKTVGDLMKLATTKRLEVIRNTYISSLGREPGSFELLATLGALKGIRKTEEEIKRINAQIEYYKSWDYYRRNL